MKITDELLKEFLEEVKKKYGDDFVNYHYSTIRRRIETHCIKLNINNFYLYTQYILGDKDMFDEMFEHFSINITEFFREPEQLKIFQNQIILYLKTFPYLKIWCAGCSTGEEAYTLSILLEEAGLLDKSRLVILLSSRYSSRILGLLEVSRVVRIPDTDDNVSKSGAPDISIFVKLAANVWLIFVRLLAYT